MKTPRSSSRRFLQVCFGLSFLISSGLAKAGEFLILENFQSVEPYSVPPGWTPVISGVPGRVMVVTKKDLPFDKFLHGSKRALLIEDRALNGFPKVGVNIPQGGIEKGWVRIRFIPLEREQIYVTPRFYFLLRGDFDSTLGVFQVNGTRLYFQNAVTSPGFLLRLEGEVIPNVENDLLIRFDLETHTAHGELNGVSFTASPAFLPLANPGPILKSLEFRGGDYAANQEGMLVTQVETGRTGVYLSDGELQNAGTGPSATHSGTMGKMTVQVAPRPLLGQSIDGSPARVALNFPQLLSLGGFSGQVKLSTLKVLNSGTAVAVRWYDGDVPADFPVSTGALSVRTDEESEWINKDQDFNPVNGMNYGLVYPVFGKSGAGHLAFYHTQTGTLPSFYDITFETEPLGTDGDPGPAQWVGDVSARFVPSVDASTGASHVRVDVTDWEGDGDQDIIYGESGGLLFLMRNTGDVSTPVFRTHEYIRDNVGNPLSVGQGAAPLAVDWDGDGREDLLVGTHWNRVAFYKNTSATSDRTFEYQGVVLVNGTPLQLPINDPGQPADPEHDKDYYPVLEVADWDNDGKDDLLAGGYISGRIFCFRNTGASSPSNNTPVLASGTAIWVLGGTAPLNVGDWCASPTMGDINGDLINDLVTGLLPVQSGSGPFLRMFLSGANQGGRLKEAIVGSGSAPKTRMATPRLVNIIGDEKLDLVVSARSDIYIYENITPPGSATPQWNLASDKIKTPWTNSRLLAQQFLPVNTDASPDIYFNNFTYVNSGTPAPFRFNTRINILPDMTKMVAFGVSEKTANTQSKMFDLDGDHDLDYVYGDWEGKVWLYDNMGPVTSGSSGPPYQFAQGIACRIVNAAGVESDICVDLTVGDPFDQITAGARPVFTMADFDNDGACDLVLGDTYGSIRFFKGKHPFAPRCPTITNHFEKEFWLENHNPSPTTKRKNRLTEIDATDWDGDGMLDVVVGSTVPGSMCVYYNKSHLTPNTPFQSAEPIKQTNFSQPGPIMVDLNEDGGKEDIVVQGTQGTFWVERTFLMHLSADDFTTGYAPATIVNGPIKTP